MSRSKNRVTTSKRGFIPGVLELEDEPFMWAVLDNAIVEYGTGCWVDLGTEPEIALEAQWTTYTYMVGPIPEGHFVYNECSDYRVCYNPNCLATMETPDLSEFEGEGIV